MKESTYLMEMIEESFISLMKLRLERGAWTDERNMQEGLIMTCEGVESMLIPCLSLQDLEKSSLFIYLKFIQDKLLEDIKIIIKEAERGFFSTPYSGDTGGIKDGTGGEDKQTVDSVSFVVSSLLHFKQLFKELVDDDKELNNKIIETIQKGLIFIQKANRKKGGWSWGEDTSATANLYFTWSVIETLVDVLKYYDDYNEISKIEAMINKTHKWLVEDYMKTISEGKRIEFMSNISGPIPANYYYNLYAIVGLLSVKTNTNLEYKNELGRGIKKVVELWKKDLQAFEVDFRIPLESGKGGIRKHCFYVDRCFVPLLLKAIVLYVSHFPESELCNDLKINMEEILRVLGDSRFSAKLEAESENKRIFGGMWNKYSYSIYYTERCMEVLSRLYSFYKKNEVIIDEPQEMIEDNLVISKSSIIPLFVELLKDEASQELLTDLLKKRSKSVEGDMTVIERINQLGKSLKYQIENNERLDKELDRIKRDLKNLGDQIDVLYEKRDNVGDK